MNGSMRSMREDGAGDFTEETGDVPSVHVRIVQVDVNEGECFNPDSCCDAGEKALILRLRQMLRPSSAPQRLVARIERVLDRCCLEDFDSDGGAQSAGEGVRHSAAA